MLVLDPWFYAFTEEYKSGKLQIKCPLQMVHSEFFHSRIPKEDFDSSGSVYGVTKHAKYPDKVENVIVLKTGHIHQTDMSLTDPWSLCVMCRFVPKKEFVKMTAAGMCDTTDEILSFLWRSHDGYPLMGELYLVNS